VRGIHWKGKMSLDTVAQGFNTGRGGGRAHIKKAQPSNIPNNVCFLIYFTHNFTQNIKKQMNREGP